MIATNTYEISFSISNQHKTTMRIDTEKGAQQVALDALKIDQHYLMSPPLSIKNYKILDPYL